MNERMVGVLLMLLAILFLIIYDTGKWPCLVSIFKTGSLANCLTRQPTTKELQGGTSGGMTQFPSLTLPDLGLGEIVLNG